MGGRDTAGNSFLQEQLSRLHDRLAVKTMLHHFVVEQVVERNQTHALMMRHVGSHRRTPFTFLDSLRRIVECLIKAVAGKRALVLEHSQILHRLSRLNERGENR